MLTLIGTPISALGLPSRHAAVLPSLPVCNLAGHAAGRRHCCGQGTDRLHGVRTHAGSRSRYLWPDGEAANGTAASRSGGMMNGPSGGSGASMAGYAVAHRYIAPQPSSAAADRQDLRIGALAARPTAVKIRRSTLSLRSTASGQILITQGSPAPRAAL